MASSTYVLPNTRHAKQRLRTTCFVLCCALILSVRAQAKADEVKALHYDLRVDIPITSAAFLVWVGTEVFKDELAPKRCHWCTSSGFDASARNGLRWTDTEAAYKASNWLGFGFVPAGTLAGMAVLAASADATRGLPLDLLIIAETALIAANLNQLVKYTVGRERPFVHALDPADKAQTKRVSDNNLSFYSAHTSISFSVVVAAGTVATMRGYDGAPLVWGVGLPLAALTGYMRIAADRHYLSDVLVGAVLGCAVGFLAPFLMHGPKDSKDSKDTGLSLGAGRDALTLTFTH